jgi:hypothetical protein
MTDEPRADERPWEGPGSDRRDFEPHRGKLLITLGQTARGLGFLSFCLLLPALLGLPLGLLVWGLARHDLIKMERGAMDPNGVVETEWARAYAAQAILLCLFPFLLSCGLAFVLFSHLARLLSWPF